MNKMELSPRELLEFERAFAMLDLEKDGSVTVKELHYFMATLGKNPSESELMAMINAVDTDGNGSIEFPEFLNTMTAKMCTCPNDEELREAFHVFDKDNSGYIGVDQIRVVMLDLNTKVSEEELEDMVREGDIDGDGYLSYEEFVELMTTQ
ncbi:neo-calmodulin-like [Drosophila innubila]|uniref:neo-calmodulin-like n=1 Tax=Drosophila innubila TaxID=198719 RepID=UPI00148B57E9|nr:neo-calmodulin-like [Drosophila innubila]